MLYHPIPLSLYQDAERQRQIKAFKDAVTEERKEMQRQALLQQVEMERKVELIKKKMRKESAQQAEEVMNKARQDATAGLLPQATLSENRGTSAPNSPAKKKGGKTDEELNMGTTFPDLIGGGEDKRSSSAQGMNQSRGGKSSSTSTTDGEEETI